MCDQVVEWGRQGKSRAWMAAQFDVSYQTLLNWERAHPEFFEALARAEMRSQAHWEDLGHDNIKDRDFNSSVWSRSMAARFPNHWREKLAHVGGGKEDEPIKQELSIHAAADAFTSAIAGVAARVGEGRTDGEPGSGG
jgi:hypothetical protein